MNFNTHFELEGQHAFLSASKYGWINDDEEKLRERFHRFKAAQKGTKLHEIAKQLINESIQVVHNSNTFNSYVNDAIGYRMTPEQTLYYSPICFGTADAISFRKKKLRIHDLKTGRSRVSMRQLEIYAALFCLEYGIDPFDISTELRIYQSNQIFADEPAPEDIRHIMQKIVHDAELIERMEEEG